MKKTALLTLLIVVSFAAQAQLPENFNTKCASSTYPYTWLVYNPLPSTMGGGEWRCTPVNGRPLTTGTPTPGMQCTGFFSGTKHLDTSYLISPEMSFTASSYPGGHVYMRFDTKKENLLTGARVGVIVDYDTIINPLMDTPIAASLIMPDFGVDDASDWVTHQADLSLYIGVGPVHIAFRYISIVTEATAWYLDNINLTTTPLNVGVAKVSKDILPVTVIGNSTSSQITISYTSMSTGSYRILIYDMLGQIAYDGQVHAQSGTANYNIDGLYLHPGMYCIKMGNENTYGTTKFIIQ